MRRTLALLTALTLAPAAGCSDAPATPGAATGGGRLAISVAPLSLPGVADASYTLTVTQGSGASGDIVWTRDLSSAGYGDGAGSLSYVGPCDADVGVNTVTLELLELRDASGVIPPGSYLDPTPVSLEVTCLANRDVPVTFDLTVARDAQQGFFDVAVEFDDLFCSAKLDCVNDQTGGDLELLSNPSTGARDLTAVLGFACTGSLTGATWLYMDDPVITCTGLAPATIHFAVGGQGNVDLGAEGNANPGGYLFAASVFRGEELLANKAYWNVSFGLDAEAFDTAEDCTLSARATAADAPFEQLPGGFALPADTVYPVIDWSVPLSTATARACTEHQVNVAGSGVATHYTGYLSAPNGFTWSPGPVLIRHRFDAGAGVIRSACPVDCPLEACGADGVCADPTCDDQRRNGDETDVDCGGGACPACGDGDACAVASDCESGVCDAQVCAAPTCDDAVANGDESDVDCGGGACPVCSDGDACAVASDCESGVCDAQVCAAPACDDGVSNGDETGVDCGGATCPACAVDQPCASASDCASGVCGPGAGGCAASVCASGSADGDGAIRSCVASGGTSYEVRSFHGGGAFVTPTGVSVVEVLIVAGGGGGGASVASFGGGGGGGGGGLVHIASQGVIPGQSYPVSVGAGGTAGYGGSGSRGGNSSAFGITAIGGGGGGGGAGSQSPSTGGSGGGAGYAGYGYRSGAAGTVGQGYAGGNEYNSNWAAGGGGAGGVGGHQVAPPGCGSPGGCPVNGGLGGPGLTFDLTGTARTYARGGDGSIGAATDYAAGAPHTGDGGNGSYAAANGNRAGAGGSGIVIVRFAAP